MNRSTDRRRPRPALAMALATAGLASACGGASEPATPAAPAVTATAATTATTATAASPTTSATTTTTSSTSARPTSPAPRTTTSRTSTTRPPAPRPTTTSRTSTTARAGSTRCQATQVRASVLEDDAGAGQRYATLTLRNTGSARCTVTGYAGMQLLTASGAAVPTRVVPSGTGGTVTLRPGASAASQLHWSTVPGPGDPSADRCPPTANRVRVTPPGETRAVTTGWDLGPVCGGGRIDAEPLQAVG